MRIGIDARFLGPVGKGLGRYTQKLIENLEKISSQKKTTFDKTNQYFIFLRKENFDEYQPKDKNFHKVLADYRWYTFSEQFKFPFLLRKYKLDLVHFPHFNVPIFYFGKFIVTIHDLILVHFPTTRSSTLSPLIYWIKFLAYKMVIKSALFRSNKIIAVSRFTKKDILKEYPKIPNKKVTVIYEASEECFMSSPNKDEEILSRYGIIKPYLIYVGNVYPHKNPERLILALDLARKKIKNLKLVFVGGKDYFYKNLETFVSEHRIKNIIFSGYAPDYELNILLRNAVAYVRPSLYEGFELPPLEAMAKGVPVLSSNHTCALEILEDSALYFNPKNIKDIAQAIIKIYQDKSLRQRLIQKGYQQIKKYSWERMAEKTLKLYNSAKK